MFFRNSLSLRKNPSIRVLRNQRFSSNSSKPHEITVNFDTIAKWWIGGCLFYIIVPPLMEVGGGVSWRNYCMDCHKEVSECDCKNIY